MYQDALRHGRAADAEAALAQLAQLDPQPQMYIELAELRWRLGRTGEARETLRQGLESFPADKALTLRLADTYMAEKRPDEATQILADLLKDHPGDVDVQQRLARLYIDQQRPGEALHILSNINERETSALTLVLRAKAYLAKSERRQAEKMLTAALRREPDYVPALAELGFLYETENKYEQASDIYERLLELGETSPELWLRLIGLALRQGNNQRAYGLTQAGPKTTGFRLEAARLFLEKKRYGEAEKILTPLTAAPNPEPGVWFFMGVLAFDGHNNVDEALGFFNKIPDDSPLGPRTRLFKAQLLLNKKRYDEALAELAKGRSLAPNEPEFAEVEAITLHAKGDLNGAQASIDQSLEKWPGNSRLEFRKAMVLFENGREDDALAVGEELLRREPNNAEAQNFVGYVLADKGIQLDRALGLIRGALEQEPNNGYVIDSLAWAHFRRNELPKAYTEIRRAVALLPKDAAIWEHYGDIAKAMGKAGEARKAYGQALVNDPRKPELLHEKLKGL